MTTVRSVTISVAVVTTISATIVTMLSVTVLGALAACYDLEQGCGDLADVHLSRRTGLRHSQPQPDKPAHDPVDGLEPALLEEDGLLLLHAFYDVVHHRSVCELQLQSVPLGMGVGHDAVATYRFIALLIFIAILPGLRDLVGSPA